MATLLNHDMDMIERMELDLVGKAQGAYTDAGLAANIHGIFSLDDLEQKEESDLCNKLAVGVGYAGAEPHDANRVQLNTAPGGNAVQVVDFLFHIILAVPYGTNCLERYSATRLLTVLRSGILGTSCSGDTTNRTWVFVKESPNISESTESMLYYSQVWRLAMPVTSKA